MTTATDDDLIRAHADLVFATCMRLTGNAQDAADVSQEVFIAWMQQRGQIRGPVAAWLHGTARRRSLDWLRRHHRRAHHEKQSETPVSEVSVQQDGDWKTALDACLATLDSRQRTLVIEHHLMGLSQESLATRWNLSQATISRHLSRGMQRLRRGLAKHGVTAATVAAISVMLGDLSASESCPRDLTDPLLAHAKVLSPGVFVGAGSLTVWWTTWPAITATCLAALVVVGASALLTWRGIVSSSLPADPVGSALARLPAVPRIARPPISGVPRYPSIEALIDRLPPFDEARQQRIRNWLTHHGTSKPWAWLHIPNEALRQGLASNQFDVTQPIPPVVLAADRQVIEAARPLLRELTDPSATLTAAGWVARDYQNGCYHWHGDIVDVANMGWSESRYLFNALARKALVEDEPQAALADLDAFSAGMHRHTIMLISSMLAMLLDSSRDDVYLRLTIRGTLSQADLRRWCSEPPLAHRQVEEGILGDSLLIALPRLQDYLHWGDVALSSQSQPEKASAPDFGAWFGQPFMVQMMLDADHLQGRMSNALAGKDRLTDIVRDIDNAGIIAKIAIPNIAESSQTAAQVRLAHSGKRMMAWLIDAARRGQPLPNSLDAVVSAVADGEALLGGNDQTYGLRYHKLSDTRFRLEIDPNGRSPIYADPRRLAALVQDTASTAGPSDPVPPIVIRPNAWEADVQRLTEPAATQVEFPSEDFEPIMPEALN